MQSMKVADYKPGDRVVHLNGATGVVTRIAPEGACADDCVHVTFEPVPDPKYPRRKWQGAYPQSWLDQHKDGLVKISN